MTQALRLLIVLSSLLSFGATAQWIWTDKDGRKVFSDRAPTADIPEKSILKRPGATSPVAQNATANIASDPSVKASAPAQSDASSPKPAGVDKDLAERKKKAELAQAAQRKAEEERISKAKAENCQRAKQAQKGLDSGMRMGQINSQGEREIMDDTARAAEAKRIQSIVNNDCK